MVGENQTTDVAVSVAAELVPAGAARADRHPAAVYLARLAPGGRRAIADALRRLAGFLSRGAHDAGSMPWREVRYQHAQAARAWLAEKYAPATANLHLAALRGVLKEAWRLGLMSAEDYHRVVDVELVRGSSAPAGRAVTAAELDAVRAVCAADRSPAGRRDGAALALLASVGPRRRTVVGLDLDDYDAAARTILFRKVKGGHEVVRPVSMPVAETLDGWLGARGREPGPLFTRLDARGRPTLARLTEQTIYDICRGRAATAGVAPFSPHDLRRTVVTDLLERGVDLLTVQHIAGHARPETTARYDRRSERAMREAVEKRDGGKP